MEIGNINSKLIKEHWGLLKPIFEQLSTVYKKSENPEANYYSTSKLLIEEWKLIYPKFVLKPIEKKVLDLFNKIQTKEFEKEKDINVDIEVFEVYYYTTQYFNIFIEPHDLHQQYEELPRFEIKTNNENIILRHLFEAIWLELFPNYDFQYYYDVLASELKEYKMLYEFLSKCWLETKKITKSDVIALLSESTGCDTTVYLDGTMKHF